MTIRDRLNRRIILTYVVLYLSVIGIFFGVGFSASCDPSGPPVFAIPFFLILLAAVLYLQFGIRCPSCRNPVAHLTTMPRGGWIRLGKRIRFCPFCGVSFDSELTESGEVAAGTARNPQDRPIE
jgi:hypothetical protein